MMNIRTYKKTDRLAIRQICCDVANQGESIESFFPDRELAADLLTSYYTDYEPESLFVADAQGQVVAYIEGCLNNRRYGLAMLFLIIPKVMLKGLVRGTYFKSESWPFMKALVQNWKLLFVWRKESFHSHQGHLHIGVSSSYRGQKVGAQLIKTLLAYAKDKGVDEMSASVHDNNTAACRFFEQVGFVFKTRYPMVIAQGQSLEQYNSISYVKNIA